MGSVAFEPLGGFCKKKEDEVNRSISFDAPKSQKKDGNLGLFLSSDIWVQRKQLSLNLILLSVLQTWHLMRGVGGEA